MSYQLGEREELSEIEFAGVTKCYPDGTEAVSDLDLLIGDGEFVILVGPSGCGKTSALRMVAGLEDVTEGEVRIGGEVVNDRQPKDRDVAMVFQNYALYPHMTVAQNMGFALRMSAVPKAEIERRVREAAEVLDLSDHLTRKPARLSGGQRQRVAMGRAIVREPQAFLMDEPLSNLDAKLRVQMRTEIARLQARLGTTTIYVTHDQTEAMTLGDRVAVMRHGLIQQVGPPDELYERPRNVFVAGFVGSPPMSFMPGRVADGELALPLGRVPLSDPQRHALGGRREVITGIRCEDIADQLDDDGGRAVEVEVVVDVIEKMGAEAYAYFTVDQHVELDELAEIAEDPAGGDGGITRGQVVARMRPRSQARPGERIRLLLAADRLHLFDPESGEALRA